MRSTICVIFLSSLIWAQSQAPPPVPASEQGGGGTVTGTVKVGTKPVRSVTVVLQRDAVQPGLPAFQREGPMAPPGGAAFRAVTDERGQFVFNNVPPGDYRVGPIPEVYMLPDADAASIGIRVKVSDGQSSAPVELSVVRGGVITGKITDSEGRPVIAERVNLSRVLATGRPRGAEGGNRSGAETDDRGIYRIYGLSEGRYVLSAGSDEPGFGPMRRVRYPRTWHPNVQQEAQATIIEVSPGRVIENVDVKLGEPAQTFTVEGRTIDASTGRPVPGITVTVMQVRGQPGVPGGGVGGGPAGNPGMSDAQGVFRISGLPSGNYAASINAFGGGPRSLSSDYYSEPVRFQINDGDAGGLEVRLHQGVSVSGILRIEGVTDGPTIVAMLADTGINAMVRVEDPSQNRGEQGLPASGRFGRANISPDGTFRIGGLSPGQVTLSVNPMRGPSARLGIVRIERNGAAVPNEFHTVSGEQVVNLAIVVREANASIRGKVIVTGGTSAVRVTTRRIDASGQSGANSDMVDQNGNFEINGLMPGSYEVTARAMGGRPQMPGPPVPPRLEGRPGAEGGGGAGKKLPPVRMAEVKQMVTVTAGNVATVTLTLDLSQQ
jgi:hypothetical protein